MTTLLPETDPVQQTKHELAHELLGDTLDDMGRERYLPQLALMAGAVRMQGSAYTTVLLLCQLCMATREDRVMAEDRLNEALAELTLALEHELVDLYGGDVA